MTTKTPKEIVKELDRFVIGQKDAKKAVAVALRNRWRRKQVDKELREEITPHNILMVGPTGIGKTEIARRLAKFAGAPFLKVEATKFTEIGYVGRDVDSIIRDLVDVAIKIQKEQISTKVEKEAQREAQKRLIEAIVGEGASQETKNKFFEKWKRGELDQNEVEISLKHSPSTQNTMPTFDIPGMPGGQMGLLNLGDMLSKTFGGKKEKIVKLKVPEAYKNLVREETDKLIDEEEIIRQAIKNTEEEGIVFLDEIDKIAANSDRRSEVNREGVQRDLLPLIEGTIVNTKYGPVKTNHILFIASGAFHLAKPADLLPELQGRLPIRVELLPLTEEDLIKILEETENSLPKQYKALLKTENVSLKFSSSGIAKIAEIATKINQEIENIGARRLHTILEKVLEDISFSANEKSGKSITIDDNYVKKQLVDLDIKNDLSKFIL